MYRVFEHVTSVRKALGAVGREMTSKSQLNVQKVWGVWLELHLFRCTELSLKTSDWRKCVVLVGDH